MDSAGPLNLTFISSTESLLGLKYNCKTFCYDSQLKQETPSNCLPLCKQLVLGITDRLASQMVLGAALHTKQSFPHSLQTHNLSLDSWIQELLQHSKGLPEEGGNGGNHALPIVQVESEAHSTGIKRIVDATYSSYAKMWCSCFIELS